MNGWSAMAMYCIALVVFYLVAHHQSASVAGTGPAARGLGSLGAGVIALGAVRGVPISFGIAIALACLVVSAVSDLAMGLVFDAVTASAACGIVVLSLLDRSTPIATLGAAVCIAPLLVLYALTRGRGIGLGDVKLGGIIGASVGGLEALGAIGAAFVAGALCCMPLVISRRARRGTPVPFAPFMALGTLALVAARVMQGHG